MVAWSDKRLPKSFILLFAVALTIVGLPKAQAVQPMVVNVSSTTADGAYGVGDTIDVTVQFSQIVTVTGTPLLALRPVVGSNTNASYISGSGTDTIVLRMTSPAGSNSGDLDYAATTSLTGTIKNSGNESAILTLPAPGSAGSLSANKSIAFEYFDSHVSGVSSIDASHMSNVAYSSLLGGVLSANGTNIVLINAADTSSTVVLNTGGNAVYNLQIYGDKMYWTAGANLYSSPLLSPAKTTILTHTLAIVDFARTANYWTFVDSNRALYRLTTDGNFTKTLVATLSSTVVDFTSSYNLMYLSPNANKVIWITIGSGTVSEIDVASGSTSTYANISKCSTNPRGMMRLDDGSEYYFSYTPTTKVTHRWPDGRITCPATSYSPWMMGGGTTDGTNVFITTYSASVGDYRVSRFTPTNVTWYPISSYDPASAPTFTTLSQPSITSGSLALKKGASSTLSVTASVAGKVTFLANGKRIPKCIKVSTVSLVASCTFSPSVQGAISIVAILIPTSSSYASSTSAALTTGVGRRISTR